MLLHTSDSASTIVDTLLTSATQLCASDIHLEPQAEYWRVRMRIDGLLTVTHCYSFDKLAETFACIKILAALDIAEQRLPQDGQFTHKNVQCRVSTCPTYHGEKIVIRLLPTHHQLWSIDQLGLIDSQKKLLLDAIAKPQGLILVTGPTGSGKTSTLYAALSALNHPQTHIVSIEDPIEIPIPGINQIAVNLKAGLSFARALRAFLRLDPDVIMVGEIRDEETADIACKAALSGHLVFSTLHTNSATDTVHRLLQMGVAAYHLAPALNLVIAQRLVRKKTSLGYQGRIGIFEMLPIDAAVKTLIETHASASTLTEWMHQQGLLSLKEMAALYCANNITDETECLRVIA